MHVWMLHQGLSARKGHSAVLFKVGLEAGNPFHQRLRSHLFAALKLPGVRVMAEFTPKGTALEKNYAADARAVD